MKLQRFIGNFDFSKSLVQIKDKELVNQIKNVLRFRQGFEFLLGDGKLSEARVKISKIADDLIEAEVIEVSKNKNEPLKQVILYCAILKRENFEIIAQKATEVGVKEIVPIISARTIKLNLSQERLKKIIKEAAEQSGRGMVPVLRPPAEFKKALDMTKSNDLNLFFDSSGQEQEVEFGQAEEIGIFIGPEGGWESKELELIRRQGNNFKIISLGKLTLRAETAAIIACHVALNG